MSSKSYVLYQIFLFQRPKKNCDADIASPHIGFPVHSGSPEVLARDMAHPLVVRTMFHYGGIRCFGHSTFLNITCVRADIFDIHLQTINLSVHRGCHAIRGYIIFHESTQSGLLGKICEISVHLWLNTFISHIFHRWAHIKCYSPRARFIQEISYHIWSYPTAPTHTSPCNESP